MNNPGVWITILTYNSCGDILECLESLKNILYVNHKILVVDNASSDDSVKQLNLYIQQHPSEPIKLYELKKNYGYAGGNNHGIKKALKQGAEYVLILNPDTVVEKNFLQELVKVAEEYKKGSKLAFFGSRILLYDASLKPQASKIYSNGGLINWSQTKGVLKDYGRPVSVAEEKQPFETDYVTGTCLLVSREAIESVGLMREGYFLYYEDTDWAIRARKQGIAQVIVPASTIWHKVSASTKAGSFSYIYYHTRNGLYCGWWNGNIFQKVAVLLVSIWIFVKQPLKLFIPAKRAWAKPVMQGVIDFWQDKTGKYGET